MSDDGSRQSKRSGATRMKKTDKLKKSLEESKKRGLLPRIGKTNLPAQSKILMNHLVRVLTRIHQ